MFTANAYEAKLPEIMSIEDEHIVTNYRIPVGIFIQEAYDLYSWCQPDKQQLCAASLDWYIVEDIPVRADALREAQTRWITQKLIQKGTGRQRTAKYKKIYQMHNYLLHKFRYAYRKNENLHNRISDMAGSQSNSAIIQNLNDLAVIGKNNPEPLLAINFKIAKLDVAVKMTNEMAEILAVINADNKYPEIKKIRDQALTFLKLNIDEIRACGQHVFWKEPVRRIGYASNYLRENRKNWKKQSKKQESA